MSHGIIWAGPALDPTTVETSPYVSPAAVWWNSRLVLTLNDLGKPGFVISHLPQSLWPRGEPHAAADGNVIDDLSGTLVRYWNVPGLRTASLCRSYRQALRDSLPEADSLVTYNPYPYTLALGSMMSRRSSCRWVSIFADAVSDHPVYKSFRNHALRSTAGGVFLSWHDYTAAKKAGAAPSLHLDGGIDTLRKQEAFEPPSHPMALYTGALNHHAGIETLVKALPFLDPDIQVGVCGRGSSDILANAFGGEPVGNRLQFHGMVDEATLHRLSLEATCFVNPRPTGVASQHNFPSKILRYLGYGKPVASTRTWGLSPDYEQALTFADSDDPRDVAASIEGAIASASDDQAARARRDFVKGRSWELQGMRFLEFLEGE